MSGKEKKKIIKVLFPFLGVLILAAVVGYCIITQDCFWGIVKKTRKIYYGRICMTACVVLLGLYTCFAKFNGSEEKEKKKGILIFLITPVITFLMLEYASSAGPSLIWWEFGLVQIARGIFEILILLILQICLYGILNSMFFSGSLICLAVILFDLANYYTYQFRGIPILASDLTNAGTALNVAGNYDYTMGYHQLMMVVCMVTWMILLFRIRKTKIRPGRRYLVCAGVSVVVLVISFLTALYTPIIPDLASVYVSTYRPNKSYRKNGVLLTFARSIQLMFIEEPDGYSAAVAKEIAEPYLEVEKEDSYISPNVIAIMDEAFADLQAVGDFETSEDVMPFYRSLTENTVKGFTYVSVFGGQTVNSEFEFLTGLSKAFFPEGATAYRLYIKNDLPNLTTDLKQQGYQGNIAWHPYLQDGYSRLSAYRYLGFDDFISIEDVEYSPEDKLRIFISDEKDVRVIMEEYEKAKAVNDEPFYLFNVTMQNHSSYALEHKNFDKPITVEEGYDFPEVVRYINLIKRTDDALKLLIEYFSEIEEPTVIVFFGDHEPSLPEEFYSKLLGKDVEKLSKKKNMERYKTPFLIWANYDIEETDGIQISTNYLSTYMKEVAGMKQTPFNEYLLDLHEQIPVFTANGYFGENGKFYELDDADSPYYDLIRDYEILQYNSLFDSKNRIENFFW